MYKVLGITLLVLAALVTSPWWLRTLNKLTVKTKDKRFLPLGKFMRSLHKPLGILLAIVAVWHGWLAWGSLRPHTGMLAFLSFLVTAMLGGVFYKTKDKKVFRVHKIMALVSVALVLLHILWPSALFYLFGL